MACLLLAASCTDGQSFETECPAGTTRFEDTCVREMTAGSGGAAGAATAGASGAGNAGTPAGGAAACSCPPDKPYCDAKGSCVACTKAEQCPLPSSECRVAACLDGVCGATPVKAGTLTSKQKPHDCTTVVCNGEGGEALMPDPADAPLDDGNPCTNDVCDGDKVSHPDKKAGEPCGSGVCNGAGTCGECLPGAKRCLENQPQTCSGSGTWIGSTKCASPDPVCSAGSCTHPTKLVAGGSSACALLADKTARCWGGNGAGQIGPTKNGEYALRPQALGLASVTALSLSVTHGCAVLEDSSVRCWGRNDVGQLGDGSHTDSASPVIAGMLDVDDVKAASTHTCAVRAGQPIRCWGRNKSGELGVGMPSGDVASPALVGGPLPRAVATGATFVDVENRGHTCAVLNTSSFGLQQIKCWGDNSLGQLGTGTYEALSGPGAPAAGASIAAAVVLGSGFSCMRDLAVRCWGNNEHGEIGTGQDVPTYPTPQIPVGLDGGVKLLGAGSTFACATRNDGTTLCWGSNTSGELATGTSGGTGGKQLTPVPTLVKNAVSLALGNSFGCALLADNRVQCWGANGVGSLGDGTKADRPFPADVAW